MLYTKSVVPASFFINQGICETLLFKKEREETQLQTIPDTHR